MTFTGTPAAVALLSAAVPTGSGAYVLARKMGGDAALVANILTAQVIAAALTIPLVLSLAGCGVAGQYHVTRPSIPASERSTGYSWRTAAFQTGTEFA